MPHYIVKLPDAGPACYLIWSTIVDAPVTNGMTREQLETHLIDEAVKQARRELPERLERVEAKGTSEINAKTLEDTIGFNLAGKDGTRLTIPQIAQRYCLDPDGPEIVGESMDDDDEEETPT